MDALYYCTPYIFVRLLAAMVCIALLGSCGGGGGGGGGGSSSNLPAQGVTVSTSGESGSSSPSFIPCAPVVTVPSKISNALLISPYASTLPGPGMAWLAGGGFTGNPDGPANLARFSDTAGMAFDSVGNLYLSEFWKHTIRKISPQGIVSTVAGQTGVAGAADGQGIQASLNGPNGVAIDSSGNVFVADQWNRVIRKISPAGTVSTFAGSSGMIGHSDGTTTSARFMSPTALTIDPQGNLYVVDDGRRVRKINPNGVVTTLAGTTSAPISSTQEILRDPYGTGVASTQFASIPETMINGNASSAYFVDIRGITSDLNGNLYVTDNASLSYSSSKVGREKFAAVRKITPNGEVSTFAGTINPSDFNHFPYADLFPLTELSNIAVDAAGNLIVQIGLTRTIFTSEGKFLKFSSNKTILAPNRDALLDYSKLKISVDYAKDLNPTISLGSSALTTDKAGNLYYFDPNRNLVMKATSAGALSVIAGEMYFINYDGVGSRASFDIFDSRLTVDAVGNLYVVDPSTVRRVSSDGLVTTVKLAFGSVPGLIGGGVDSDGALYLAQSSDLSILKTSLTNPEKDQTFSLDSRNDLDINTGQVTDFKRISAIRIDADKNIFLADRYSIRKVTPNRVVSTCAGLTGQYGSTNSTGVLARFSEIEDFVIDSQGNIFVLDTSDNNTIRKISPNGMVSHFAGQVGIGGSQDGSGSSASFYYPKGIAIDRNDNLYIADTGNYLIRKITPSGIVSTVAGKRGVSDTPKSGQVSPLTNGLEYMRSIAVLPTPVGAGVSVTLAITMTSGVLLVSLP